MQERAALSGAVRAARNAAMATWARMRGGPHPVEPKRLASPAGSIMHPAHPASRQEDCLGDEISGRRPAR